MSLNAQEKAGIVKDYQLSGQDTGSTEVQVALLSKRIGDLTEHFKIHKKDNHSRYGLQAMVNQRRKLLKYLKRTENTRYYALIEKLSLRDSY